MQADASAASAPQKAPFRSKSAWFTAAAPSRSFVLCCVGIDWTGTAKSELSRRLNKLVGGAYFERLLTRFSVPEELFGPLSMKGLENDEYVRQIDGYLPTAEVR